MISKRGKQILCASLVAMVVLGACAPRTIVTGNGPNETAPVFDIQEDITIDWEQARSDAEEQFNDASMYPLTDYIDVAVYEDEKRILLIWLLDESATTDDALKYGTALIKGYNDIVATQDFSIARSTEDSYGGLFEEYSVDIQVYHANDIMEEGNYLVNQSIPAGSNDPVVLQVSQE